MPDPAELPRPLAVAFDCDGLLLNTEDVFELAGTEMMAKRGHRFDAGVRGVMIGKRADEAFAALVDHLGLPETIAELRAEASELFTKHLEGRLALMLGVRELVEACEAAGLPRAVCTSSGGEYLRDMLTRFDLRDRFDVLLAAEDVTRGKPDPEIYETAAARLGVPISRLLVLEDSGTGCAAGVAAGALTVAVPNRHTADMNFAGAALVADGLTDPRVLGLVGG